MKKNTTNKIKLGVFISIGILLLIVIIYFIGERQQMFRSTFRLSGVFRDIAGLQVGNNVRLSGVNIGTVDNIEIISDTSVNVIIIIDKKAHRFIRKDAIASIGSEGLMGNKVIIINPGKGGEKRIRDNDVINTSQPIDIDSILTAFKKTIDNTADITSDLASMTKNIESGKGTLGKLIMDKEWRENFEATFINLKHGSNEFRVLMEKANNIDDVVVSVKETIKNTAEITANLSKITGNLEAGKGTFGRLLMDSTTAINIDSTFINLKEGTSGLKTLLEKAKTSWLLWGF